MIQEVIIFNKVNSLPEFRFSGADICRMSGLEKSQVSRFLSGKIEFSVGKFFQLIRSMPPSFQRSYWEETLTLNNVSQMLGSERVPWTALVSEANYDDLQEILNAMADRWAELRKGKEKDLVGVG